MQRSPSKRRRTSPTTFVRVNEETIESVSKSNPSTPRRASYLSPTKASLARSHPAILEQSRRGARSDPRRSLRNQILDNGSPVPDPISQTELPANSQPNTTGAVQLDHGQRVVPNLSFADAITNAFNSANTKSRSPSNIRAPLNPRQPAGDRTTSQQDDKVQNTMIVPKLIPSGSSQSQRAGSERRSTEPDLPPTPVQLGLGQAPERPRGLVSSSSPGGSGRRRVRTRDGNVTSSPLKPKEVAPRRANYIPDDVEIASGIGDDEVEEQAHQPVMHQPERQISDEWTEEAKQKQAKLSQMQNELQQLKNELEKLKTLNTRMQTGGDVDTTASDEVIKILKAHENIPVDSDGSLISHPDFVKNPDSFWQLFAPSNLKLAFQTSTKHVRRRDKLIHQVTVAAPPPWPDHVLKLTFEVVIDIGRAQVENIKQLDVKASADTLLMAPNGSLQKWIAARLASPIHKHDLAGIFWGAGKYMQECIKRAKVLKYLSELHEKHQGNSKKHTGRGNSVDRTARTVDAPVTDLKQALSLLPYLANSQMSFSVTSQQDEPVNKELMLIYKLDMTWTSSVKPTVEIIASGVPPKAQDGAKDVFRNAMQSLDVVDAFEAVWNLLEFDGSVHQQPRQQDTATGKTKRKRKTFQAM